MASYIIGLNKTFFFQIDDVRRININEEEDLVEFFNRQKDLIFACNKIDMDFVAKWDEDEIPPMLSKIYNLDSGKTFEDTDEQNPTEEPTPEEPIPEPFPEEPTPEEPSSEPETQ